VNVDRTLFGAILDRMDEGVYAVDAAYRIVLWNAAAERITGYPASEILGRSCTEGLLLHLTADGRRLCEHLCPSVAVIDRADQLMYASKQAGRDRVTAEPARRIIDLTTQDA
jgi:PAS domain-containing protein